MSLTPSIFPHFPSLDSVAQACLPPSSTFLPNTAGRCHLDHEAVEEMYQNYQQQKQEQYLLEQQQPSSESDDWSEPNREVSRARIGLDVLDDPDSCLIYPPSLNRYSVPPSLCPVVRTSTSTVPHKKSGYKSKRRISGETLKFLRKYNRNDKCCLFENYISCCLITKLLSNCVFHNHTLVLALF